MIIVQYLDLSRSFGLTNRRNRGLVRQLDLHKISTAFEALISRRVITAQSIHDEFTDLSPTGCQRLIYKNVNLGRTGRRIRMIIGRRIRDDFACLVFPIRPLFGPQVFYLVFQFPRGSPCQVFARFPQIKSFIHSRFRGGDYEESGTVRCHGEPLKLCEKVYRGLAVSFRLWIRKTRQSNQCYYWCKEISYGARFDVPFTKRICRALKKRCCACICCPQGPTDCSLDLY